MGSAFTAHLGAATKIRLLQDLDRENRAQRRQFSELVKRVAEINMERNRYIHSEYPSVPATEQLTVMPSDPAQLEQAGELSSYHRRDNQNTSTPRTRKR